MEATASAGSEGACPGGRPQGRGYISAAAHLSAYRTWAERRDTSFDDPAIRTLKDYKRSAERGMGPGQQSMGLPFERLGELPKGSKAWVPLGPLCPRYCVIFGAWFLAREVELSCVRASLVTVKDGARPSVTVYLPASKST